MVIDVAREQFESRRAPTVIVPVERDGETGVLYATYEGGEAWMAEARAVDNQEDLAIACCKLAYADALKQGLTMRTWGKGS